MSGARVALWAALGAALLAGCDGGAPPATGEADVALAIGDEEGAVCGMLVRDQSAPRAQVVHRDGTRAFLCSIGDLLSYLQAPSPHGRAEAVLVEVMTADEDPLQSHPGPHPWLPASDAVFLVGVQRHGIMGEPVLVYRDVETAERVAGGRNARTLRFGELQQWWEDLQRREAAEPSAREQR